MRKLLLLCATMLGVVGAWAQERTSAEYKEGEGQEITLTNVQPNGDRITLYVEGDELKFSTDTPENLGDKAKFVCTFYNGKYSFYNVSSSRYIIWRNNSNEGYDGGDGTMENYNPTYCDWSIHSSTQNNIVYFYMLSKRSNGKDGSIVLLTATGESNYRFDGYGNSVGYTLNTNNNQYSNLFVMNGLITYLYNEELDETYTGTYSGTPGTMPTISGIHNLTLTDGEFTGSDGFVYKAKVQFPLPVSSVTISNPIIISSFKNYSSNFDWYSDANKVKVHMNPSFDAGNISSYLWEVYPKFANNTFTFSLKNTATGTFIHTEAKYDIDANGSHDKNQITLTDTPTEFFYDSESRFYYTVTFDSGNTRNHYLSHGSSTSSGTYLGIWTSGHNGTKTHTPAISFTSTITSAGYSTLYSPIAVAIPEGVTAYTVTAEGINDNYVTLTERTDGIAANEGVIIAGGANTYTFTAAEVTSDWTDNLLEGSFTNTYVQGDAYVLSASDGEVGLYKAKLNKDENGGFGSTHFKNNAGKAYLPASEAASDARFLVFSFGDDMETGITETENGNVNAENYEVYDLAGRRVQNAQKGIFIVNGKKVVR